MGHALEDCQAKLKDCFDEFNAIEDKSKADHLSIYYFSRQSVVSQQLYACCFDVKLHDCPDAFVDMQERSFASLVARYIESEHKKTRHALHRGLTFSKPAYTCARQRSKQITTALKDPAELNFFVGNWQKTKGLWRELLGHLDTHAAIVKLSRAERHAKVYQYHKDHIGAC